MPPKARYSKEEIVNTALGIAAEHGMAGLTAKELSVALGTSTSPIFTVFDSMQELQGEVRLAAMARFEAYAHEAMEGMPVFKRVGMKMISFAKDEPRLYELIFMSPNSEVRSFDGIYAHLGSVADECLDAIRGDYGLSVEDSRVLFEHSWIHTYGIATLCATGMCDFSQDELSAMLSQDFSAMMLFLKRKEKKL